MADLNSRDLVRGLFQLRDLPRAPFIPWVCGFAAQLEQVSMQDMLSDAGLLSTSLGNAQKLVGYDAICNVFDPTLESEALGCGVAWGGDGDPPEIISHPLGNGARLEDVDTSGLEKRGRIPAVLEATRRLKAVKGKDAAILAVITGPVSLAANLNGEDFPDYLTEHPEDAGKLIARTGAVVMSMARLFCEMAVDGLVVADEMLGRIQPDQCRLAASPLKSVWNVARFYHVNSVLLSRNCTGPHVAPLTALGADGVALSGGFDRGHVRAAAVGRKCAYAETFPPAILSGAPAEGRNCAAGLLAERERGFFLSTEWEASSGTNVDTMHEIMKTVKEC